jgi:polyribonucleotide nucleotidyltransferase
MATVCSGSLALMDGGVPVKCAVSGIAMGLVKEEDQYSILSDILGNEDHLGDMDFKVAGSKDGITAIQMDIKIQGISFEIMEKALNQANEGRMFILNKMNEAISVSRDQISEHAPTILSAKIKPDKIGTVIGPGGKVIQGIQKDYGVEINIDEDGTVHIASPIADNAKRAKEYIKLLTAVPEEGKIYEGKIVKIEAYGAFVEILPDTTGLLHISQVDTKRINSVTDVLKVGEKVKVKLLKIENGKYSLSRKVLLEKKDDKQGNDKEKSDSKKD